MCIYICVYICIYICIHIYIYGCFLKWGARKSSVTMVVFICFHHIQNTAIGFPPSDSQPVPSSSSWRSYWSSVAWPATSGVIHRRPGWEEAARCCTRTFEMPTWWRRKRKSPRFFSKLIEKYHGVIMNDKWKNHLNLDTNGDFQLSFSHGDVSKPKTWLRSGFPKV